MTTTQIRLTTALAGRYRVDRELGAGGMATVYLALDLRHEREVAIKVLHPDLGAVLGSDRFLAEIKTTARLQHPHILPLLDSGAADGLLYYVMPYVRGETLRTRLDRDTQLAIADAVRIASEVADALQAAHTLGVIHRDIKPENILLQDGHALVADFGIALAVQQAGGQRMTQTGLSLGTPQYMSPEQATGEKSLDARTDIYALAAVTYEMLTGGPPFTGGSVQAIMARIMTSEPEPLTRVRKTIPVGVEAAVLQGLAKLPADRMATAREFAEALHREGAPASRALEARASSSQSGRMLRASMIAAVGFVAAGAGWWVRGKSTDTRDSGVRTALDATLGEGLGASFDVAISADGRQVASIVTDSTGTGVVRVRDLADDSARTVPGTEGARNVFFSPDGSSLLFTGQNSTMRRIASSGGATTVLAQGVNATHAHWSEDGWIYYSRSGAGIWRVRDAGGAAEKLTEPDTSRREFAHWDPHLLPGGKAVLFYSYPFPADSSRIEVFDLAARKRIPLISNASNPRYVTGGFLTFVRDGTVFGVRFDVGALRLVGTPLPVQAGVAWDQAGGAAAYVVADNGTLAYVRRSDVDTPELVYEMARDGNDVAVLTPTGRWAEPRLSPDQRYLALSSVGRAFQIHLYDRTRGVMSQLTRGAGSSFSSAWSSDGKSIIHATETPAYDVVRTPLDGSPVEMLVKDRFDKIPTSVSSDGQTVAFTREADRDEVVVRSADGRERAISASENGRGMGVISPDGKWIAYREQASGQRAELYAQSMSGPARHQLSANGGEQPRWTKGGRELVYRRGAAIMAVAFDPLTGEPGLATELFRRPPPRQLNGGRTPSFDVSPDGSRFFVVVPSQRGRTPSVAVILNWRSDLERALSK